MNNYVTVVENSGSSKFGDNVSATYAPIQSCPQTCPFLNKGCYAQLGNCRWTTDRISKNIPVDSRPSRIALAEARSISKLTGKNPLRLHVVGDCKTPKAASILAEVGNKYKSKYNQTIWTYTHAWENVPREAWGDISVLASCDTLDKAEEAYSKGYAISTVRWKPFTRPFTWGRWLMQPCLSETKGMKCKDCRMCWSDKALRANRTIICFFPHGAKKNLVTEIVRSI